MNASWKRLKWFDTPRYDFEKDRAFRKALDWWLGEYGPRPPRRDDTDDGMNSEHMRLFSHINTLVPYNCYPGDVCEAVEQELHALQMHAKTTVTIEDVDMVVEDIEDEFLGMLAHLVNHRERYDKRVALLRTEHNICGTDLMNMVAIKLGIATDRGLDRWKDTDEHNNVRKYRKRRTKAEDKIDKEHEAMRKDRDAYV